RRSASSSANSSFVAHVLLAVILRIRGTHGLCQIVEVLGSDSHRAGPLRRFLVRGLFRTSAHAQGQKTHSNDFGFQHGISPSMTTGQESSVSIRSLPSPAG